MGTRTVRRGEGVGLELDCFIERYYTIEGL